ncbi:NAD(P)-dependent oxidoreductase [Alicyclobacillus fastidiosus]|uniref:NAD(P)-dependent oxidoreductase n=1 Tax=Alicyclobacillus fastidiosus TaxID=392011 RepID=A0ABV5AAF0_9BACL|nr:NAD(P)-dependent oxidoreductase [Alicyclobacillus fastidiosus]WEH10743.1 NAD(P)-dependent oxidoreductase [Alicyclobacillus fastidiosus]
MPKHIAFIGLGAMGFPMAKRLCQAGFHLDIVLHRHRQPVEELVGMGATLVDSVATACRNADVIISILPSDKEMAEVLLNADVRGSVRPGTILLEMTSGTPNMMAKVEDVYVDLGCHVLDAPVSGGTIGAANGSLTVMAGGNQEIIDKLSSIFDVLAKQVFTVGQVGDGKAIKAINQMLAGVHMVAASEAIRLAQHLHIDMERLKDVVAASSGASWMFLNKIDTVLARNFEPGFKLDLMKKDIRIALDEGKQIPLPITGLVHELYQLMSSQNGDEDFSVISTLAP